MSTADQDAQAPLEALDRAARSDGCQDLVTITETGSGALNDRPGLSEVLALARRRAIGAVYVWKLERFGRSALDLLRNLDQLERSLRSLQGMLRLA